MKKVLMIAAVFVLAGALLALTGFAMGARPNDTMTVSIGPLQIHSHHGLWNMFFTLDDSDEKTAAASPGVSSDASAASAVAPSTPQTPSTSGAQEMPASSATVKTYQYHSLEVDAGACSVVIQPGDDFVVTSDVQNHSVKNDGGKLEVEAPHMINGTITITVPRDFTLRSLEVSIDAGSLTMTDVACEKGDFELGAGEMNLENVTITRESSFDVGMGTLTFSGSVTGKTDVECGVGSVELNVTRPQDFGYEIEVGGGTVTIDGQSYSALAGKYVENRSAATFFEIECGMGEVTIGLS